MTPDIAVNTESVEWWLIHSVRNVMWYCASTRKKIVFIVSIFETCLSLAVHIYNWCIISFVDISSLKSILI